MRTGGPIKYSRQLMVSRKWLLAFSGPIDGAAEKNKHGNKCCI